MFPNRDIDIYTAAKNTPEREKEFVLSVKIKKLYANCTTGNENITPNDR